MKKGLLILVSILLVGQFVLAAESSSTYVDFYVPAQPNETAQQAPVQETHIVDYSWIAAAVIILVFFLVITMLLRGKRKQARKTPTRKHSKSSRKRK